MRSVSQVKGGPLRISLPPSCLMWGEHRLGMCSVMGLFGKCQGMILFDSALMRIVTILRGRALQG